MELSSSNIKKTPYILSKESFFLYFIKRKPFLYFRKRNPAACSPNHENKRTPPWENFSKRKLFLYFRKQKR